jgi:hypothetical protein
VTESGMSAGISCKPTTSTLLDKMWSFDSWRFCAIKLRNQDESKTAMMMSGQHTTRGEVHPIACTINQGNLFHKNR